VQVLSTGQQVKHQQYGLGIVTDSDAERTAIDFDDHGKKLFVTSMMSAELIGDAPVNPTRSKRRIRKTARRS
jgi:phosphomannomutase